MCYTCVRECPAKAIRIVDGQAEIIGERCINCGNCVKVCSQPGAKIPATASTMSVGSSRPAHRWRRALRRAFPAEFHCIPPKHLSG